MLMGTKSKLDSVHGTCHTQALSSSFFHFRLFPFLWWQTYLNSSLSVPMCPLLSLWLCLGWVLPCSRWVFSSPAWHTMLRCLMTSVVLCSAARLVPLVNCVLEGISEMQEQGLGLSTRPVVFFKAANEILAPKFEHSVS